MLGRVRCAQPLAAAASVNGHAPAGPVQTEEAHSWRVVSEHPREAAITPAVAYAFGSAHGPQVLPLLCIAHCGAVHGGGTGGGQRMHSSATAPSTHLQALAAAGAGCSCSPQVRQTRAAHCVTTTQHHGGMRVSLARLVLFKADDARGHIQAVVVAAALL